MATKVKIHGSSGHGHKFMHLEVNAGASGEMGDGTHEFTIGAIQSAVHYLTIHRLHPGKVQVLAETGDVYIDVDGGHPHQVKKGKIVTLPPKFHRAVVHERPHH